MFQDTPRYWDTPSFQVRVNYLNQGKEGFSAIFGTVGLPSARDSQMYKDIPKC